MSGAPTLAFCERVTATATSPWHIRRVGPEGLKLGGGAPDTTLCGRPLDGGWDLLRLVEAEAVAMFSTLDERGRPAVCGECAAAYAASAS